MIKIIRKIPLLNSPDSIYTGACFNKNKYIVLNPFQNEITEYNNCIERINEVAVNYAYSSITKIPVCPLYYTVKQNCKNTLYRITECYKEVDSLSLKVPGDYNSPINSISINPDTDEILIATNKKVYSVDFNGNFITSEISKNTVNNLLGTSSQTVTTLNNKCCPVIMPVKNCNNYISCAGYFCHKKYIAYTKDNSAYLAHISKNGNLIETYYIGDDITINSLLDVKNTLQLLITKNTKYNYIYITDMKCLESCCCDDNQCCDKDINYLEIINKTTPDCDYLEIINDCCHKNNPEYDIVESIALVEAAISHILNAEGEKIQKMLEITEDPHELLKVNDSVNEVIKNVTFLEHVLYSKLELAKNCGSFDSCNDNNDPEDECQ